MRKPKKMSCPVCRARFRGSKECSRCGADLGSVMTLAIMAWRTRQAARQAILAGDPDLAEELLVGAQKLCSTPVGAKLQQFLFLAKEHK